MLRWRASVRAQSTGCLRWPLGKEEKFSDHLLEVERHWKGKIAAGPEKPRLSEAESKYILAMFPYPSGTLHMGHMRVYSISDVLARYYRLAGHPVIHPIGWDAFGLPAENAARERGADPRQWTESNIESMRAQLLRTGVEFDWSRETRTCDPEYYKWTQWIFTRMHDKGLVKRGVSEVNWDPVDGTVLAAEQIDADGRSWRSGAVAEKRKLRQWAVETPRYAKRLSEGLSQLSQWHEVADIQAGWIGPCDVYRFQFPVKSSSDAMDEVLDLRVADPLQVSRTSHVVIRQGHSLSDKERDGETAYLSSHRVLNGVTGQWMPVVVVDSKTAEAGPPMHLNARCGAECDAELLKTLQVPPPERRTMPMNLNDVTEIASFGGYGGYETSRTLQDWVVSRQRAWGTPIPMVVSECGKHAAAMEQHQLPLLQGVQKGQRVESKRLPAGWGYAETDTLDTFFDSAWYYLRYLDPHNANAPISPEAAARMPVDVYVGGVEHAAVHMFFARFVSYFLTDIGVTKVREPFKHLVPQGIVRGRTYRTPAGAYVKNDEVVEKEGGGAVSSTGEPLEMLYEKMSKSKHNGVDPLQVVERDGVDLARLQLLDTAAPRAPINWGDADLKGLKKWLDRTAWVVNAYVEARKAGGEGAGSPEKEKEMKEVYNYFVRNTSMLLEVLNIHNTAIARLQGLTNALRKVDPAVFGTSAEAERCVRALVVMMQVFAPHSAAELWAGLLSAPAINKIDNGKLSEQPWPCVDADAEIDFMLIVNGVNCGRVSVGRQEIEGRGLEETVNRARQSEHQGVFAFLAEKGYEMESVKMDARDGFHVTLDVCLAGEVEEVVIRKMLDRLSAERRRAAKGGKEKKPKKEKKEKKKATA